MTALGATTPNPDCEVCGGTGTDPWFHGDCTECWPGPVAHREELWHARHQAAQRPVRRERPPCPECGEPAVNNGYCDLHWWTREATAWEATCAKSAAALTQAAPPVTADRRRKQHARNLRWLADTRQRARQQQRQRSH